MSENARLVLCVITVACALANIGVTVATYRIVRSASRKFDSTICSG